MKWEHYHLFLIKKRKRIFKSIEIMWLFLFRRLCNFIWGITLKLPRKITQNTYKMSFITFIDHFCCFLSYFWYMKFYVFHDISVCSKVNIKFHTSKFQLDFHLLTKHNFVVQEYKLLQREHFKQVYFFLGHPIDNRKTRWSCEE